MNLTAIDNILIPEGRQRQDFNPAFLMELANSIEEKGLFHPIVVREVDDKLYLVAGERRLRAIQSIWDLGGDYLFNSIKVISGLVPYVTLGELDELSAREAELEENTKRQDLSWQEKSKAIADLHAIRLLRNPAQTVAMTTIELKGNAEGSNHDDVKKQILIAEHLTNPEVVKAKNFNEAFKVIKRQEETTRNIELSKRIGKLSVEDTIELHHANCCDWLHGYTGKPFDVLLTDPPYGIGADNFGDGGGRLANAEHHYSDTYEEWQSLMSEWIPLVTSVMKPQAHAYIFCDIDRFHELKARMEDAGWNVFRTPLIDYKVNSGRVPIPDYGPRRQYELILFANRGKKPVFVTQPDVIPCTLDEELIHGAQKPVSLFTNLINRSCRPGDRVLDTFSGSGTILEAGFNTRVRAVGIEQSAAYYGAAYKRLQRIIKQPQQKDLLENLV